MNTIRRIFAERVVSPLTNAMVCSTLCSKGLETPTVNAEVAAVTGDKFQYLHTHPLYFGGFAGAVMRKHSRHDVYRGFNSLTKPLFLYGLETPGKAVNPQVNGGTL